MSIFKALVAALLFVTIKAQGADWELTSLAGRYTSSDGLMRNMYQTNPLYLGLEMGRRLDPEQMLQFSLGQVNMRSRALAINADTRITLVQGGFIHEFHSSNQELSWFRPFFGAGLGATSLAIVNSTSDRSEVVSRKSLYSFAYNWQLGLRIEPASLSGMAFKITMSEQRIDKRLFEGIQLGGHVLSLGLIWQVSS